MSNIRFQNTIQKRTQKIPPIWFMRQAGRYHSHYQNMRKKYSFMELCKDPEVAAEVALGPVKDFDFDVAILFSDILFPLEALGFDLEYTDKGPKFSSFLKSEDQFRKMKSLEQATFFLNFQKEALSITRSVLNPEKSLIGFVGGIWTLFTYIVDGHHSRSVNSKTSPLLYKSFLPLMQKLIHNNIKLQLEGGAEMIMMFDTSAGDLSPIFFESYVLPYINNLSKSFSKKIVYYTKNNTYEQIKHLLQSKDLLGFGVDHRFDLCRLLSENQVGLIQGNFDQNLLFLDKNNLKKQLKVYINGFQNLSEEQRTGWVFSLGHGVLPKTPEYNVKMVVDLVRELL